LPETRRKAPGSYLHEMTTTDHIELLDFCLNSKSKIILSGYPSKLYTETLENAGWEREDFSAQAASAMQTVGNNLKGKSTDIAKRTECLWINPPAQIKTLWNFEEAI
jgi:site-specific DNA-adenine methylase